MISVLFIEPYFASPKNVITNAIPLILVLFAIKTTFDNQVFWWIGFIYLILLIAGALKAMSLQDKQNSQDHPKNKTSEKFKQVIVIIGEGKLLYSVVFLYFLLTYYSTNSLYSLMLVFIYLAFLLINPNKLHDFLFSQNKKSVLNQIGEIIGVQSKKLFLVKLFNDKYNIKKFDLVKFAYSMNEMNGNVSTGIVFDTYLLNQEKWGKILQLDETISNEKLEKDIVYQINDLKETTQCTQDMKVDKLVGVITEGSTIEKIKFDYSKKVDDLQEGDLIELRVANKRLFYQVIGAMTVIERIENKNENGYLQGEALQIGEWQNDTYSFQKFGWVPCISTPIFKADTSDIQIGAFTYPLFELGNIPGTTLPLVIDLSTAISHHMAILGVTGAGKSYLARKIIGEIKTDTKVICVDFNGEFVTTIVPTPSSLIENNIMDEISDHITWEINELDKYADKRDKDKLDKNKMEISNLIKSEIQNFIGDNEKQICVLDLPEINNTSGILSFTKYFFKVLFEVAKENQKNSPHVRMCVVLEEAHTIIPEINALGIAEKESKSLVNSIGQIALQGRKYGVGFLIIAQRTANVSKTVLTQCNTVACFQAFDETSFSFLNNYIGKEMTKVLPRLKKYHAIVAGKGVQSNVPMIVDLTSIDDLPRIDDDDEIPF